MAGGRPRTGSVRLKNGRWLASVAPEPGQGRKEMSFGLDERAARAWLQAAVAAQVAGDALPAAEEFVGRAAATTLPMLAASPGTPAAVPTVMGLDGALVPGRGHDIEVVFRAWLVHYYRSLGAGGGLRETNVESHWADHIHPYLLAHGEKVGSSGIFCVEELHLTLSSALKRHLRGGGGGSATGPATPAGPTLHGSVSVREAVTEYGLPKSTVENYRKAGRFPNATNATGVWLIPREDLRQAGLLDPNRPGRGRPTNGAGLAEGTTSNILWVLQQVEGHAKALGLTLQGNPTHGLVGHRKKKAAKDTSRTVTLSETRALAGHLHVVHQLVLLCLRTIGMRISELYGVKVGDVVTDGRHGVLVLQAQGGRPFLVREGDDIIKKQHVSAMKNSQSERAVVLPPVVLEMLQHVIRIFHTDPETGQPDLNARLIPGLRASNDSGSASFRSAFAKAASAESISGADIADDKAVEALLLPRPHDLRKSFVTDLAWDSTLHEIATRRYVGHAPGTDVHALSYVLDQPEHQETVKIAQRIHDEVMRELDGHLIVPTAKRPGWGRSNPIRQKLQYVDALLLELGWQVPSGQLMAMTPDDEQPWLDTPSIASVLGRPESTTRTWLSQGVLPAEKRTGSTGRPQWFARLSDVDALREHLDCLRGLPAVAEELGLSYADAYTMLHRLGLTPDKDARTGELVITDAALLAMRDESERQRQLATRAMPLAEVAEVLGVTAAVAGAWLRAGKLTADAEKGPAGRVMVTRESVHAAGGRRRSGRAR
jgi:integrase